SAVSASADAKQDTILVWHADGRQSSIIGSQVDRNFQVRIETDKREFNIGIDPEAVSPRVLRAALDALTEGAFPRLWRATTSGSVSGNLSRRGIDPTPAETFEVIALLDAAQR